MKVINKKMRIISGTLKGRPIKFLKIQIQDLLRIVLGKVFSIF